jgi:hypothetical protein
MFERVLHALPHRPDQDRRRLVGDPGRPAGVIPRPVLQPSGAEVVERALRLGTEDSPDAVGDLVSFAEGRRAPLEAAGSLLVARLHRRSDDFVATRALCSVSAALSRIGWVMPSRK